LFLDGTKGPGDRERRKAGLAAIFGQVKVKLMP
jgi:hypothetical protein